MQNGCARASLCLLVVVGLLTPGSAAALAGPATTDDHMVIISLPGTPVGATPIALPDERGILAFEVRFREFSPLGPALRDLPPSEGVLDFGLVWAADARNGAEPATFLYRASAADIVALADAYEVRVPVWAIVPALSEVPTMTPVTAWAALRREAGDIAGYHNAAATPVTARDREATRLDHTASPFLLDWATVRYGGRLVGLVTERSADREGLATLVYDLQNTGSFTETFRLRVEAPALLDVAFNPGTVGHPTTPSGPWAQTDVEVAPGEHFPIAIDISPHWDGTNGVFQPVYLNVSIPDEQGGDSKMAPLRNTGRAGVAEPNFTVSRVRHLDETIRPGDYAPNEYSMVFKVQNNPVGVTDSFTVWPMPNESIETASVHKTQTPILSPGDNDRIRVTYKPKVDVRFGSFVAVGLVARADHGGQEMVGYDFVRVATDEMEVASPSSDQFQARPGESVTKTYDIRFKGPYVETLRVTATHGIFSTTDEVLDENGAVIPDGRIVLDGTNGEEIRRTITIRTVVPAGAAFGTRDTTTVRFDIEDDRSAIPLTIRQFKIDVVSASISISLAPTERATHFALPGDAIRRAFDVTYSGDISWTFDLKTTGTPFGVVPQLSHPQLTFPAGTGIVRRVEISFTVPAGAAYGTTGNVGLGVVPVGLWNAPIPDTLHAPVRIFRIVPNLTFDQAEVLAWPRGVASEHGATVSLDPLTPEGAEQWAARGLGALPFAFAFTSTPTGSAPAGGAPGGAPGGGDDHWDDTLIAPTTLAPGESARVVIRSTADGFAADRLITLTMVSNGLLRPVEASASTTTHVLTPDDVKLHQVLVGCYGADAATCVRREGPIQALTTHDLPAGSYSRGYLAQALIITRAGENRYVDLAGTGAIASVLVDPDPLDPRYDDVLPPEAMEPSPYGGDAVLTVAVAGGQPVLAPSGEELGGVATLLWETRVDGDLNKAWFLGHLGTASVIASLDVHGLAVRAQSYDAIAALFPLGSSGSPIPATFLTDKDDPDGDNLPTAGELIGRSNPLLRGSSPGADDDGDCLRNAEDPIPIVDEAALLRAAADGLTAEELAGFVDAARAAFEGRGPSCES